MRYQQTTQVPNILFDKYLPHLTDSELKILLIIIRQTYGWIRKDGKGRKTRDRITHRQFCTKTGLCRRVVSKSIQSLVEKKLIKVTDSKGEKLHESKQRAGRAYLYYQPGRAIAGCVPAGLSQKASVSNLTDNKHISNYLRAQRNVGLH